MSAPAGSQNPDPRHSGYPNPFASTAHQPHPPTSNPQANTAEAPSINLLRNRDDTKKALEICRCISDFAIKLRPLKQELKNLQDTVQHLVEQMQDIEVELGKLEIDGQVPPSPEETFAARSAARETKLDELNAAEEKYDDVLEELNRVETQIIDIEHEAVRTSHATDPYAPPDSGEISEDLRVELGEGRQPWERSALHYKLWHQLCTKWRMEVKKLWDIIRETQTSLKRQEGSKKWAEVTHRHELARKRRQNRGSKMELNTWMEGHSHRMQELAKLQNLLSKMTVLEELMAYL